MIVSILYPFPFCQCYSLRDAAISINFQIGSFHCCRCHTIDVFALNSSIQTSCDFELYHGCLCSESVKLYPICQMLKWKSLDMFGKWMPTKQTHKMISWNENVKMCGENISAERYFTICACRYCGKRDFALIQRDNWAFSSFLMRHTEHNLLICC